MTVTAGPAPIVRAAGAALALARRLRARPLGEAAWAGLVLAAYLPVALFAIGHHEMWRDELHCWLVARDSHTPWDVVRNRAYDGHPPLWYLLLWVLEKTTHDPRAMQVVHVALAAAAVWVFARFAPFPRAVRALFPFGYFLAYEYVAISRCYGMALLLCLVLCAGHRRALDRPWLTAGLLAALALTTTVSTAVAVAYAAALALDWLAHVRAPPRPRDRRARRGWIPIAIALLAAGAAGACAWPPADSTVTQVRWPTELPSDFAPTRLIAGLLPVPRVDFFFWNSNLLLSYAPFARVALLAAAALGGWILFLFSRDRGAATLFAAGAVLLMAIFGGVYGGDVRHHGFFFVLFLMGAWIAALDRAPEAGAAGAPTPGADTSGAPSAHRATSRAARVRRVALVPTVAAVLAVHLPAAAIALAYDAKYVFSSGKRAADLLRARGLARALLVAEVDYPATAVIGQLRTDVMAFSPRTGRPFSFVKWTRDRRWEPTDRQTLDYAASLGAARGEDPVLIMNRPLLPPLVDGREVTLLAELYDSMIEEENFYLYRVRARPAAPLPPGAAAMRFPPARVAP